MSYENSLKHFPNLRAKMRNSMADIRWYSFKICEYHGIKTTPREALSVVQDKIRNPNPHEDFWTLWHWATKIYESTPDTAGDLFYECWRVLHNNFDNKLQSHV